MPHYLANMGHEVPGIKIIMYFIQTLLKVGLGNNVGKLHFVLVLCGTEDLRENHGREEEEIDLSLMDPDQRHFCPILKCPDTCP
jgi:hypothetical protein